MDVDDDRTSTRPCGPGNIGRRKRARKKPGLASKRAKSSKRRPIEGLTKGTTLELVRTISIRLIRSKPLEFFIENCEMALAGWISILRTTTLPENITSSDRRIVTAFKELDSIINGEKSTQIMQRLAYIQLLSVFESLKRIVSSDR
ncbi:hypothetical protein LY76DRAFT_577877 [Colletotrichum caudatum]|nr:hypothetical protein LY76DRAFT_577877 [Colletotrichum caudatum]